MRDTGANECLMRDVFILLATDAHDVNRRPPNLSRGRELAAKRVGDIEAQHLVVTRPGGSATQ